MNTLAWIWDYSAGAVDTSIASQPRSAPFNRSNKASNDLPFHFPNLYNVCKSYILICAACTTCTWLSVNNYYDDTWYMYMFAGLHTFLHVILGIDVAKNQIDWQVHSDTHITNFINLWVLTTYFPRKTLESAIKSIILVYVDYAFYIWDVSVQMFGKNISISDYFQSVTEEIRTNRAKKTMTRTTVTIFLLFLNNLCSILYNLISFLVLINRKLLRILVHIFLINQNILRKKYFSLSNVFLFLWQNVEAN